VDRKRLELGQYPPEDVDIRRSFSSALFEQEAAGSLDVTAGVNALDALKNVWGSCDRRYVTHLFF
jgi:hypothetical protein